MSNILDITKLTKEPMELTESNLFWHASVLLADVHIFYFLFIDVFSR